MRSGKEVMDRYKAKEYASPRFNAIHQVICAQWDDHEGLANLNVHAELYGNLSATPTLWHPFDTGKKLWLYPKTYTLECSWFGGVSPFKPPVSDDEAEVYPGRRMIDAAKCS